MLQVALFIIRNCNIFLKCLNFELRMKLSQILLSQLLIISLIFSGPTRADPEKPKTNTPYKTVTIIIDEYEEEEEEEVEEVASASTIVKNQDSAEWSAIKIITTLTLTALIVLSRKPIFNTFLKFAFPNLGQLKFG